MSKTSVVHRNLKRQKLVRKYAAKRAQYRAILKDPKATDDEREEARRKFQALPRDTSSVRVRNRCRITGRPNGVYRKFGLARSKLREAAMRGDVPGLVKASW